jgi:hypothetical protein
MARLQNREIGIVGLESAEAVLVADEQYDGFTYTVDSVRHDLVPQSVSGQVQSVSRRQHRPEESYQVE